MGLKKNIKNKSNIIFLFLFSSLFVGCQGLSNNMANHTNNEMKKGFVELATAIHSIMAVIGIILLAYSINELFLTDKKGQQGSGIGAVLKGLFMFVLGVILINFKYVINYMMGT